MIRRALFIALLVLGCASRVPAAVHYLIVSGSGGEEEYDKRFFDRANRLKTALTKAGGTGESFTTLLAAQSEDNPLNLEKMRDAIRILSRDVKNEDDLIVLLIGHGSQIKNESKFQIPGPDLEAKAFGDMLKMIAARRIAVIDTTASSSGFINALGGEGRIICTATKSGSERNATMFAEYLAVALEEGSADQNRDERISLLEWLQQADTLTHAYYTGENLIASEHALLDDNGDALGSRVSELATERNADKTADNKDKPRETKATDDGTVASEVFIRDFDFPSAAPKELVEKYLGLLQKVEDLKSRKSSMPAAEYERELERLLIDAAKSHREIRAHDSDAS